MTTTKSIGDEGEKQALDYFVSNDYCLVAQNYRYKRNEIDLVVRKNNTLIFVEVKYRSSSQFGYPENAVDNGKITRIQEAAENLIHELNWMGNIRFDIISIVKNKEIEHFKDIT